MEIIRYEFKHNLNIKDYFKGSSIFFDIETTGFNRKKDIIYLIGILYEEKGKWILEQYFLNNILNEYKLIDELIIKLNSFDNIINYNGNAFDIPFVNERASIFNLQNRIDKSKSIDIYSDIRRDKELLNLENLKLKTIEEFLGYYREDQYSGYDCIRFYKDYIKNNNDKSKAIVLIHNRDDLIHMLDIIEIYDYIYNEKKITFKYKNTYIDYLIENYNSKNKILTINGYFNKRLDYGLRVYENNYDLKADENNLTIQIALDENKIKAERVQYIDLKKNDMEINKNTSQENIKDRLLAIKYKDKFFYDNIKMIVKALLERHID